MIRTSVCILPSEQGTTTNAFRFTEEYARICLGVLPQNRHQLRVFCHHNCIFNPERFSDLSNFQRIEFSLSSNEKLESLIVAMRSLITNIPNAFNVGRLILVCEDITIFPKSDNFVPEYFVEWSSKLLQITQNDDTFNFHQIKIDLIVFHPTLDIDVWSNDKLIHVIVKKPEESEFWAQQMAFDHLRLSHFKFKGFQIYFLDVFNQSKIVMPNVSYHLPNMLLPPVIISYPCVFLKKDTPVTSELSSNVIIFYNEKEKDSTKWLLSMTNGNCFLSQLGELPDDDVIKQFSFTANIETNRLIQAMPPRLILSPIGDNWNFSRTEQSLALTSMTRLSQIDDQNVILFSPQFLQNATAYKLVAPIISAVSKSLPTPDDLKMADMAIGELFNTLLRSPHEILAQNSHAGAIPYPDLIQRLVLELKIILQWFEVASPEHSALFASFSNRESLLQGIHYQT
ncbi:hypothetical protein TRFO_00861 [Tritrichomonas foetus]|uniref:Uncharacterized protein n=1 Tax=Tritrichomonas foetus TaxID=1144522 RepID=A0A1J4L6G7_9EUKA|nr:hypothetical protein TRFO_00861 [Tritrichomonas foetus]|eukprot:OHT17604.1 hypothetical protein TRFO_00861 [Tritrichomonas foetus]